MRHALLDKEARILPLERHCNNFKNPLIQPRSFLHVYLVPIKSARHALLDERPSLQVVAVIPVSGRTACHY